MTKIQKAMMEVEAAHFRTDTDTGANPCAMLVWNALRARLNMSRISRDDLAKWDGQRYVAPQSSKLLTVVHAIPDLMK